MPRRRSRQCGGAAFGGALLKVWVGRPIRSPGGARISLGVLRERSMRRFLAAQLASISGDFIVIAALPFAVFSIGGSSTQVGTAFGAGALLEVLAVLFGWRYRQPFQMLGASVAAESLGGPGAWAVILTAAGIGQLGGGLVALLWRPQCPLFAATLLSVSWAVPPTLPAIAAPLRAIALTVAVAGTTLSVFGTIWHTTLQSKVPEDLRSRMSSYDWLGSLALLPLGYLIAGAAQSLVGAEVTLIAAACVVLAAAMIVVPLPMIRGMRSNEQPRALVAQ